MTNTELEELFVNSNRRIVELEAKSDSGAGLTRHECDELRHCTARLGLVAKELWIAAGKPDDPEFEILREPIKLSPLPACYRPLDLSSGNHSTEVH